MGMNAISSMDSPPSNNSPQPLLMGMHMGMHMGMQQPMMPHVGTPVQIMSGMGGMQQPMMGVQPIIGVHGMYAAPFQPSPSQQPSLGAVTDCLSHPIPIHLPDLCSGLSVTMFFRNGAKPAIYANACCVVVVVRNTSEQPIRRIKLTIPSELKKTPQLEDISSLSKGQEHSFILEIVLQGYEGKQVPIIATCDRGTFNAVYVPEVSDLLTPLVTTPEEFLAARSRLTSFHEVTRVFEMAAMSCEELCVRVKRIINTRHVQSTPSGDVYFASCLRKGMTEERVLVTISMTSQFTTVRLNCDNAAFSNTLMETFKKKLV